MKTPKFWKRKNFISFILYPLSIIYYLFYKIRCIINHRPYKSKIPVVCVGNITIGGSGKTPVAIEVFKELKDEDLTCCFLSKGYGGNFTGVVKLDNNSTASEVGDEPMILFEYGDVFVSKNRVDGLKFINNNFKYNVIIMDDGLQNPTFTKAKNILVIDGDYGFGNNLILPAGPMRESFGSVYKNIYLAIINNGNKDIESLCKKYNIPHICSETKAIVKQEFLENEYVAFCGLGIPDKFKNTLLKNNIKIKEFIVFEDHHKYTKKDIEHLKSYNCKLITTKKDWIKLDDEDRKRIDYLDIYLDFGGEKIFMVGKNPVKRSLSKKFCDRLGFYGLSFIFLLSKIFPIQFMSFLFGNIAMLLCPFIPTSYLVLKNLENTMPEKNFLKKIGIMFGVWRDLGRFAGEYPYIHTMKDDKIFKYVKINNRTKDVIREIKNNKVGSILFSGHISNWEVGLRALRDSGVKLNVVYRELNNPLIEPRYDSRLKENLGIKTIAKHDNAAIKIIRALKNGENIIILTDQKDSSNGIPLNFFNRKAYTSRTIYVIAKKLGIPIYGIRVIRNKKPVNFSLEVTEKYFVKDSSEVDFLQKNNDILEKWIREHPEQWFWVHNRWKV
jgi:tetraacyldisaccharide 4'-kinase